MTAHAAAGGFFYVIEKVPTVAFLTKMSSLSISVKWEGQGCALALASGPGLEFWDAITSLTDMEPGRTRDKLKVNVK